MFPSEQYFTEYYGYNWEKENAKKNKSFHIDQRKSQLSTLHVKYRDHSLLFKTIAAETNKPLNLRKRWY
jgi:hypothetical protein